MHCTCSQPTAQLGSRGKLPWASFIIGEIDKRSAAKPAWRFLFRSYFEPTQVQNIIIWLCYDPFFLIFQLHIFSESGSPWFQRQLSNACIKSHRPESGFCKAVGVTPGGVGSLLVFSTQGGGMGRGLRLPPVQWGDGVKGSLPTFPVPRLCS